MTSIPDHDDEYITVHARDLAPRFAGDADAHLIWHPLDHRPRCERPAWQARALDRPGAVGLRVYCTGCGIQNELVAGTGWQDVHGDVHGPSLRPAIAERGHQAPSTRVAGLWMHPEGRPVGEPQRPVGWSRYRVTASPGQPSTPADVVGVVGVATGPRGATRWAARVGEARAPRLFNTPTAAARWIAKNRQEGGTDD